MRTLRIMSVVCVGWLVAAALAQIPPGYELIEITDGSYYDFRPKINNRGQVVFTRWYNVNDRSTEEIFLYDRDQGGLIRLTSDNIQDVDPDINDDGVIAWGRGIGPIDPDTGEPGLEIVIRAPDGQITRITNNSDFDYPPRINNLGQLVWERHIIDGCFGAGLSDIFMWDGAQEVRITEDVIPEGVSN